MQIIVVEPIGDAWIVRAGDTEPQVYASGAKAEDAAKIIAHRLALAGYDVELYITLRDGRPGARFRCFAPLTQDDQPLLVGGSLINHQEDDAVGAAVGSLALRAQM